MPGKVVSQEEWLKARRELLVKEKSAVRANDELTSQRRALPMVKIDKEYTFEGPNGTKTLADIFEGRKQLIIYHFMFSPEKDTGCNGCSFVADNLPSSLAHLQARNTTLVLVSRAPIDKVEKFKSRLGWNYTWYSSFGSTFNYDFHVTNDEAVAPVEYNYKTKDEILGDKNPNMRELAKGEGPGLSVFLKEGGEIFHTYSTFARGLEGLIVTDKLLDLTPLGRQDKVDLKYHDVYDDKDLKVSQPRNPMLRIPILRIKRNNTVGTSESRVMKATGLTANLQRNRANKAHSQNINIMNMRSPSPGSNGDAIAVIEPPSDSSIGVEEERLNRQRCNDSAPEDASQKNLAGSPIDNNLQIADRTHPQRTRKGHKKSRQGCFNCKRRKIKCQETLPSCDNCLKRGLECLYPSMKKQLVLQESEAWSLGTISFANPQSTPTLFTPTDMRLFHHFLLEAYPHLPVGNDSAWLTEIPLIAHNYDYLMHAILAMAASHLELCTGVDFRSVAIHHRILAIKGSNTALSQPRTRGSDNDALLAACYALTFQSSYMSDGLAEFFQMVRGCHVLSYQFKSEKLPMVFTLTETDHFQFMEQRLLDLPFISPELVDGAEKSLRCLPPLFNLPVHMDFYQHLTAAISAAKLSSLSAYFKFIYIYDGINRMDSESFQEFVDPNNKISQILIAHFVAMQFLVAPIIARQWQGRSRTTPVRSQLDWITSIYNDLPPGMRKYIEWPRAVGEGLASDSPETQPLVPGSLLLMKQSGYLGVVQGKRF
ncbi:hypothetical protein B7463_g7532, partial [Scytalidium lignicola]